MDIPVPKKSCSRLKWVWITGTYRFTSQFITDSSSFTLPIPSMGRLYIYLHEWLISYGKCRGNIAYMDGLGSIFFWLRAPGSIKCRVCIFHFPSGHGATWRVILAAWGIVSRWAVLINTSCSDVISGFFMFFFRNMIYLFDVQPCWIKYTTRSKHNDGVLPSTITWTYDAGLLPYGTPQIRAWVASNRKRTLSIMNEHKSSQLSNSIDSPIMTKKHQQKSPKKEIWPKWSLPIPKWFVQKKTKGPELQLH